MADDDSTGLTLTSSHPDAEVVLALRRIGAREIRIPDGSPSLWIMPGTDAAVTWKEMVRWMAEVITNQRRAQLVKRFWQTSEFWFMLSTLAGFLTTAVVGLANSDDPNISTIAGAAAVVAGALYKSIREKQKELAAKELDESKRLGNTNPPLTPGGST